MPSKYTDMLLQLTSTYPAYATMDTHEVSKSNPKINTAQLIPWIITVFHLPTWHKSLLSTDIKCRNICKEKGKLKAGLSRKPAEVPFK